MPRALPRRLLVLAMACATASAGAQANQVHRRVDGNGVVHYSDRGDSPAPAATTHRTATPPPQPAEIARLRLERHDDTLHAHASNLLAGPLQVQLRGIGHARIDSQPTLPATTTLAAGQQTTIARIAPGDFQLKLDAVPGPPHARHIDVEYAYPLHTDVLRVQQAWGGHYSHSDAGNRHAVDFAAPAGTPVLAARAGAVMQVEARFGEAAPGDRDAIDRANFVRILHDDGSMALYAHLRTDGVFVQPGQRVTGGQAIGLSGNTGFSTGPHLHFVVQVNRGMRLESVPFRMTGPHGPLRFQRAR